jgi:hypothetical protein
MSPCAVEVTLIQIISSSCGDVLKTRGVEDVAESLAL